MPPMPTPPDEIEDRFHVSSYLLLVAFAGAALWGVIGVGVMALMRAF